MIVERKKGLVSSLATLATTLVTLGQTRLELLGIELEEAGSQLLSLIVLAFLALFCLGLGLVLVTLLFLVIFWDEHRVLALGLLAGGYGVLGLGVCACVVQRIRTRPKLFAASLAALSTDRARLAGHS